MRVFILLLILSFFSCNEKRTNTENDKSLTDTQFENIDKRIKNASLEIKKQVPKDSIYNFVNNGLKDNEIYNFCECFIINDKEMIALDSDKEFINSLQNQINIDAEKEFISNQFFYSLAFNWDETKIKNKRFIKLDDVFINEKDHLGKWQKLREEYNCCTTHISMPIFFNHFNNCVINVSYSCGSLCAEGAYFIYERENNGKWTIVKEFNRWIS